MGIKKTLRAHGAKEMVSEATQRILEEKDGIVKLDLGGGAVGYTSAAWMTVKAPGNLKGYNYDEKKKTPKRKQTRRLVKPRKPKTKKLIAGGKWNYETYVGNNGQ